MRVATLQPPKQVAAAPEEDGSGEPLLRPTAVGLVGGLRKKAAGVRSWLLLDSTGQAQVVEVGKHAIMRRTGLPARDLRILDPLLSYPSTVLGRERAIVINLEHIKAIITAQEVFLLNSKDPSVIPFVDELQRRILRHHQAVKAQEAGDGKHANWTNLYDLEGPQSMPVSPPDSSKNFPNKEEGEKADGKEQPVENRDGPKLLPFEFVALEACLEAACSCLDNEARTLEQEAHPALDKLTSKISTLNLERVRQIKSRLVAITGRVQKVRDELEHLLDDDDDMAEMYLTDKLDEQLESSSVSTVDEQDDLDEADMDDRTPAEILEGTESSYVDRRNINSEEALFGGPNTSSRQSHGTHTSTHSAISKHLDVEELEMLLEAYFVQIDGTLNKLSTGTYEKGTKQEIKELIYQILDVSDYDIVGRSGLEVVLTSMFNNLFHEDDSELKQIEAFINAANLTSDSMSFEDFQKWSAHVPAVRKYLGSLLKPSDSGSQVPKFLIPDNVDRGQILLTKEYAWHIGGALSHHDLEESKLLYHSGVHGQNFNTFLGHMIKAPTLFVLKDKEGCIYGGYASQPWERHSDFYGDMKSFVFQLYPKAAIFRPTGANHNIQWFAVGFGSETIPNGIGFGGKISHLGLFVSANFDQGHTFECTTFSSPSLSKTTQIYPETIECWGVVPAAGDDRPDALNGTVLAGL